MAIQICGDTAERSHKEEACLFIGGLGRGHVGYINLNIY